MTKVAIVGAGMIGRGWALVFAGAGFDVALWDPAPGAAQDAVAFIAAKAEELHAAGLQDMPAGQVVAHVTIAATLADCVRDAVHVQENGPENLPARIELFSRLDELAPAAAVIASSTSGMPPSAFSAHLAGRHRCLVAHPPNPPYLLPLVELCPAPWTTDDVMRRTADLLQAAGRKLARMTREKDGFILNRLQGAMLAEALRLIGDGVIDVEGLDTVVKHGLGLRWAFMGPLETVDLNAPGGFEDFCARYGPLYEALQAQMAPRPWSADVVGAISAARRTHVPAEAIAARQAWRDRRLMALATHLAAQPDNDA
jgi:3-hydroxyacyl-CoA dehydrogenase